MTPEVTKQIRESGDRSRRELFRYFDSLPARKVDGRLRLVIRRIAKKYLHFIRATVGLLR
jgi:hypothetical protein